MPQNPKPLGPAELNSGDLAGRVTAIEAVVHSWVEVCRELRENRSTALNQLNLEIGDVSHDLNTLGRGVNRIADQVADLLKTRTVYRLRRIKRHRYPKPKGKL